MIAVAAWAMSVLAACTPSEQQDTKEAALSSPARAAAAAHPGEALYEAHCAQCHSGAGQAGAPHRIFMTQMAPDMILAAMNSGAMRQQAQALSSAERRQVVDYLAKDEPAVTRAATVSCESPANSGNEAPYAMAWGIDLANRRFIGESDARLSGEDIHRLKLRWVFAYPNANRARAHPLFFDGDVIVGSQDGTVYALDGKSGCVRWRFRASAEVRTGITPARRSVGGETTWVGFFSDFQARAYAIDLTDGELLWKTKVDPHPGATGTGQPTYFDGRLFVPVSSLEVGQAGDPNYPCCTFRGSLVALDADTGTQLWKTYTIAEAAVEVGKNPVGATTYAPSGAPIWSSPTVDPERRRLYVGTGENYSSPSQGSSDAIMAVEMDTGAIVWVRQTTEGDAWNAACLPQFPDRSNCPEEDGPDYDFGAPPILMRDGERGILVAGQKSGVVYGIDPDDGEIVWHRRLGRGGVLGGVHFGMAANTDTVFVPIHDNNDGIRDMSEARPGLYAVDAFTGELKWSTPARGSDCDGRDNCEPGISAPPTVIPGAVIAGHGSGWLRAYDISDGKPLWEFDTFGEFETVSGDTARGGGMSGGTGPIAADGWLYANSGYFNVLSPMPGNALLAFSIED